MNVLFIDQFSEMGGGQRMLIHTVDAAQEHGWRVQAALPSGGPLMGELHARNIRVTEIPCGPYESGNKSVRDMGRFSLDIRSQSQILHSLMTDTQFDLVYVNGPRVLPAACWANRSRSPLLFHMHYPIHQPGAARLTGWSLRRANATAIACSRAVAATLRDRVPAGKLHVIENGVADLGFRERASGKNGWRIGLVGRISRQKGQLDFIRAASKIVAQWPSARFSICGAPMFGEDEYSNRLHQAATGLPVDFLGWREDIGAVLEDLDLLAMPSQDEGMPRVLLEAFSAGVPVVAYPTGGIPEAVIDGETGFLTNGTSAEALATRIREAIAEGPDALRRVAANARGTWERFYMLARYQERITTAMESLAAGSPAARETRAQPARR